MQIPCPAAPACLRATPGLVLLAMTLAGSPSPAFEDILVAHPPAPSDVYAVQVDGAPVTVQRCDGREGPVSYVHVLLARPARFAIACQAANGEWRLHTADTLEQVETGAATASFDAAPGTNVLVETAARERLYLIADAPDAAAPDTADPRVVSVLERGVVASADRLQTDALQRAIDSFGERGGTLYFPPGIYRTGTLHVPSNVTLYLAARALIQGSSDPRDYPFDPGTAEEPDRTQDIRTRLLLFDCVHDAALRGRGEIDGMGHVLRVEHRRVPNIVRVRRSRNVRLEGVTLRRAAGWNTHVFHSDDVTLRDVKILANWSDGIDVDNSRNVRVEHAMSASYDDAFTVKATWFDGIAERVGDIRLVNCLLWTDKAAIKIGTETRAQRMEDIAVENVTIAGGREALTIRCYDNATVRNVTYRNVAVHAAAHCRQIVCFDMQERHGKGSVRDIRIEGLRVDERRESAMAGLAQGHDISDVTFADFAMAGAPVRDATAAGLATNAWVRGVTFE